MKHLYTVKARKVRGPLGTKCRALDGYWKHKRLFVSKTNERTWVVHHGARLSLDNMVQVGGNYHFWTLNELHKSLNFGERTLN